MPALVSVWAVLLRVEVLTVTLLDPIVKVAVAMLPYWSSTDTVTGPAGSPVGMLMYPDGVAPISVPPVTATIVPETSTISFEVDRNPAPLNSTVFPAAPEDGVSVNVGVVSVNVALAVLVDASFIVIVLLACAFEGTVKVNPAGTLPDESVFVDDVVWITPVAPLKVAVRRLFAAKSDPVIVTVEPMAPLVVLSEIAGVIVSDVIAVMPRLVSVTVNTYVPAIRPVGAGK